MQGLELSLRHLTKHTSAGSNVDRHLEVCLAPRAMADGHCSVSRLVHLFSIHREWRRFCSHFAPGRPVLHSYRIASLVPKKRDNVTVPRKLAPSQKKEEQAGRQAGKNASGYCYSCCCCECIASELLGVRTKGAGRTDVHHERGEGLEGQARVWKWDLLAASWLSFPPLFVSYSPA